MITKETLLLSLFIVVSCTKSHTINLQLQDANTAMIQARMAYLQTPEYQIWTSLENTRRLMTCYNTPEMSTKIDLARKNAESTYAYLVYIQANEKYSVLKNAS